jgi:type IV secretory pathway ATPase VirB11/archaellum biosynthesis ATPase
MNSEARQFVELALSAGAKQALDVGFQKLTAVFHKVEVTISTPSYEIEKAISDHQAEVSRWASEISFSETPIARRLADIFVPLNVYTRRRRTHGDSENFPDVTLEDAIALRVNDNKSCVVLGQPGAGKTTAMKHICLRFLDESSYLSEFQIIIRIQLRDLNLASTTSVPEFIRRSLQELMRLRIAFPDSLEGDDNANARRQIRDTAIADWLNATKALIILDGFDEVTLKQRRDLIIEELRKLALQLTDAAFLMTTRSGEFSAHVERVRYLEIMPFSQEQIATFAKKWLGERDAEAFLGQIALTPYHDTTIRPLTLAHLCVIFEKSKRIPSKPKTVYRKIVRLLLEDWDQEKSVVRESAYSNFEPDRKEEFLAHLAYELTRKFKTNQFSKERLISGYREIHDNFGLPLNQATKVVDELESHTGLFVQSGIDKFEFSHQSLQEFLAAEFIVRLASVPSNMIELQIMPNELAIATAISSQPSEYFTQLISDHFNRIKTSFQFTRSFVNRLLLEDPDFERTPRVGYALLVLYSQYLRSVLTSGEQLSLFVMDQLGAEFSKLAQKIRQRVTLEELEEVFDKVETAYTFEGETVRLLRRKKKLQPRLRRADISILPDELYLRESLLARQSPIESEA